MIKIKPDQGLGWAGGEGGGGAKGQENNNVENDRKKERKTSTGVYGRPHSQQEADAIRRPPHVSSKTTTSTVKAMKKAEKERTQQYSPVEYKHNIEKRNMESFFHHAGRRRGMRNIQQEQASLGRGVGWSNRQG